MGVQKITIPPSLALVLNSAGQKSDVDFDYLVQTAMRESSLNPQAKAKTSSATGLFQFIEATWFEVMKSEGNRLGYSNYADAIKQNSNGHYEVSDPKLRTEILELRKDPQISADLAAAFTRNNGQYLEDRFGRRPSAGELYIAHFLGARGAEKMFEAGLKNPDQIAANIFPSAAKANKSIFYDNGEPRTIKQVYMSLIAKHASNSVDTQFTAQQISSGDKIAQSRFAPSEQKPPPLSMSFQSMFATIDNLNPSPPLSPIPVNEKGKSGSYGGESSFFVQLYNK